MNGGLKYDREIKPRRGKKARLGGDTQLPCPGASWRLKRKENHKQVAKNKRERTGSFPFFQKKKKKKKKRRGKSKAKEATGNGVGS